jgi:hypothetical protein
MNIARLACFDTECFGINCVEIYIDCIINKILDVDRTNIVKYMNVIVAI